MGHSGAVGLGMCALTLVDQVGAFFFFFPCPSTFNVTSTFCFNSDILFYAIIDMFYLQ